MQASVVDLVVLVSYGLFHFHNECQKDPERTRKGIVSQEERQRWKEERGKEGRKEGRKSADGPTLWS